MLWEIYQTAGIHSAQQQAAEARSTSRRVENQTRFAEHEFRRLEARIDSLAIGCQAMWELLAESTNLTKEDIVSRMQEIDLRDGKADGKVSRNVSDCPTCSRPVNSKRDRCIYCGEQMLRDRDVFDV